MNGRRLARAVIVLSALVASHLSLGQQAQSPTLDEILLRLESNLHHYDIQVPNFFCSEHVLSSMVFGKNYQSTITDSIFRLERVSSPGHGTNLTESREIKAVNGTSVEGKDIHGPAILAGVFSGGLNTVSLGQKACMNYALQPIKAGNSGPYIVQFATLPASQRSSGCVMKEDGSGRAFIDPATMQVTRMELIVPHHAILPAIYGVWRISIDYVPVLFSGQTFWMPSTIASRATPADTNDPTVWSFNAHYTDYHKLEVTSHILPFRDSKTP